MAAPVADFIRNPDDASNTGKRVQAQYETIGGSVVYAPYVITRSKRKLTGVYMFSPGTFSVQAVAQDATATGFVWLEVPSGATIRARLRRLQVAFSAGATETDHVTVPRVSLARFTFTGTASGSSASVAKRNSGDDANVANARLAVTGMTVTLGSIAWSALTPVIQFTTSGALWGGGPVFDFNAGDDEEEYIDLAATEGLVLYQPDAGTGSDGRRFVVSGRWDEYDNS